MTALIRNNEIGKIIITAIAVYMMNYLVFSERPTKMLFHHISMFKDALAGNGDFEISIPDNRSRTMGVYFCEQGISESLNPLVVHCAKSLGFMNAIAAWHGTDKIVFSFCESHALIWVSVFSESLKMRRAVPESARAFIAILYRTSFGGHKFFSLYDSILLEITKSKEKRSGANWVNSGNPKQVMLRAIPSQAGSTLPEGVETTGGV